MSTAAGRANTVRGATNEENTVRGATNEEEMCFRPFFLHRQQR